MKYFRMLVCAVALAVAAPAIAEDGLKGDVAVTPSTPVQDIHPGDLGVLYENSYRAYVRNLEPFEHDNYMFHYGMPCYAKEGGMAEVVKDFDQDNVLVIYSHPLPQDGINCPSKKLAKFTMPKDLFARMKQFYREREKID